MPLPTQRIFPGRLQEPYQKEASRLQGAGAISKIWGKQPGLWKDDAAHAAVILNRLGWIPVIDGMQAEAAGFSTFAREVAAAGMKQIVLLGMGGSSLAPEVFSLTFPGEAGRRMIVLDTTDPAALLEARKAVDLAHTLFVVASKSGKTVETLSQFQYFHAQLRQLGVEAPGRNFIAITDEGSHLDKLAAENKFLRTFRNPADIGGRYSALSYFGLVPAALWGVDVSKIVAAALEMRAACGPQAAAGTNPGLQLGALLGAAARQCENKLALVASPRLRPLGNWIEQLIAESTGKEGKGIVPIAGAEALPLEVLARGVTAALVLDGDDSAGVGATIAALKAGNAPVVEIHLSDAYGLGGEFFLWEVATAVAGATLGIDPFDEPNVQESKDNTGKILEEFQKAGAMPTGKARIAESGIELYAGDAMGQKISSANLAGALQTFFAARKPDDYLAILAYVARDEANTAHLETLRAEISKQLSIPVLLGFGPRYMHSIGQLYKGGPASGMFLVITATPAEDLAIPGAKYTFGQLETAQALGDLQSLNQRGKPTYHLHLSRGAAAGLGELGGVVGRALGASNRASQ